MGRLVLTKSELGRPPERRDGKEPMTRFRDTSLGAACGALILTAAAVGQTPLSISVNADGSFILPPGAELGYEIRTVAGSGWELALPARVALDSAGNLFIVDRRNFRVRRVDAATGLITTVAGSGAEGYSGDGGPATDAALVPARLALDAAGNLFIADLDNYVVRRVDAATGLITTVAGSGAERYSGDGGPATEAALVPTGLALDAAGNLFIADGYYNVVRRVDAATGLITTVAGSGWHVHSGDGGPATEAALVPTLLAFDTTGNLFIADRHNLRVRRVDAATGLITTVAGTGEPGYSGDGAPATDAALVPTGLVLDSAGNLFIADLDNYVVRRVDAATGLITTVAGSGAEGAAGDGGPATDATLVPAGLALDSAGNLFIADLDNYVVRRVDAATGLITTVSDYGWDVHSGDDGPATEAALAFPSSVALDASGNLFIVDPLNLRVRRVDAATGLITTVAGTGEPGYSGDGAPATAATFGIGFDDEDFAISVALDAAGNLFIADAGNHVVRRVDAATGLITTVAGTGAEGYSGDGGPATDAALAFPSSVALDAAGNLFVADGFNHRIRKIDTTGTITTVAGSGAEVHAGDGGPATEAALAFPSSVALDAAGNLFIVDPLNLRLRRVDAATGLITTVAGTGDPGYSGDGGPATAATFGIGWDDQDWFIRLALDAAGNLFIADPGNHVVRRVDAETGLIATVAGSGAEGYSGDGESATDAALRFPSSVALDAAGNLFIADVGNHLVRRVASSSFVVSLPLGSSGDSVTLGVSDDGALAWPDGAPAQAGTPVTASNGDVYALQLVPVYVPRTQSVELAGGVSVMLARDEDGTWRIGNTPVRNGYAHVHEGQEYTLELADGQWRRPQYAIRSVAGSTAAAEGIAATEASLFRPTAVTADTAGNVFVADGRRVRKVDASGVIATFAGTGDWGFSGDGGPATEAQLRSPFGLAVDAAGNLFVADGLNHRIRKVDAAGTITTVTGSGEPGFAGDGGPATDAQLSRPYDVAVDAAGNLFVADGFNHRIRKIDTAGTITTVAGTGQQGFWGDGGPAAEAELYLPTGVAVDAAGNLLVADRSNHRIRKVDAAGTITTVAGSGERGFAGDGGPATDAQLQWPFGVAVDAAGNLFVADQWNHRIRKVDAAGTITTVAGNGERGFAGDGGPATEARLSSPCSVAADTAGNLFVCDWSNYRIRKVDAMGTITTFAGTADRTDGWIGGSSDEAKFEFLSSIVVDGAGTLYFADSGSGRIWKLDSSGTIAVVAGSGEPGFAGDGGLATEAQLGGPTGVAVDTAGNVFVADRLNDRIRKVDAAGTITTVAGSGERGFAGDGGSATDAQLSGPTSVAVDAANNVFVADRSNHRIRKVDAAGTITTVAGSGERGFAGDGGPATDAQLYGPTGVAIDAAGNLFVVDSNQNRIRKIDAASGNIETILESEGYPLRAVAVDADGNVYAGGGFRIRMVDSHGEVALIAGTGAGGFWGDGEPAAGAGLSVSGMAVDGSGAVWFTDPNSRRIRVLEPWPGRD